MQAGPRRLLSAEQSTLAFIHAASITGPSSNSRRGQHSPTPSSRSKAGSHCDNLLVPHSDSAVHVKHNALGALQPGHQVASQGMQLQAKACNTAQSGINSSSEAEQREGHCQSSGWAHARGCHINNSSNPVQPCKARDRACWQCVAPQKGLPALGCTWNPWHRCCPRVAGQQYCSGLAWSTHCQALAHHAAAPVGMTKKESLSRYTCLAVIIKEGCHAVPVEAQKSSFCCLRTLRDACRQTKSHQGCQLQHTTAV